MLDPLLAYYGQPILPAGFNSAPNDGDEVDGAGYNEPVWPYLFDSFVPLEVLIVTPEMLGVFDGCPDYMVPSELSLIVVLAESMIYTLMPAPPAYVSAWDMDPVYSVLAVNRLIVSPPEQRTLVVTEEGAVV